MEARVDSEIPNPVGASRSVLKGDGPVTTHKTPKPLTIAVHPVLRDADWVMELVAKGHTILAVSDNPIWQEADLILGPTCARFVPGMEKHLDSFIKGTQSLKRDKVKA